MQSLTKCMQILWSGTSVNQILRPAANSVQILPSKYSTVPMLEDENPEKSKFLEYNDKIYPIQAEGEKRRPAYVCHVKKNFKYSPKKMWYVANLPRGMSVDEAVKQLSFVLKKGAAIAKETILEAQKLAVEEHNVEFKSNMWVAESFCTKGTVVKGLRKHARGRLGEIRYMYCNYYVRLEEGEPPKHYYLPVPKTGQEMLEAYKDDLRKRKVPNSL